MLADGVRQNMMLWGSGASLGIDPTTSPSGSRIELPSGREPWETGASINRHSSIRVGGRQLPAVSKGRKSRRCVSRATPGSTEVVEPVAPSLFGSATSFSRTTSIVERYKHWTQHNGDTGTASTPAVRAGLRALRHELTHFAACAADKTTFCTFFYTGTKMFDKSWE